MIDTVLLVIVLALLVYSIFFNGRLEKFTDLSADEIVSRDCLRKYALKNECDWDHWSAMEADCKITNRLGNVRVQDYIDDVKAGQCDKLAFHHLECDQLEKKRSKSAERAASWNRVIGNRGDCQG